MVSYDDNAIVESGKHCTIEYAVNRNGKMPAKRFLDGLGKKDKIRFSVLFQGLANNGKIRNKQKFSHLKGTPFYQFKISVIRILCFQRGRFWYLTRGFAGKHGAGRCPPKEIDKARKIMEEHLNCKLK